MPDPVVPRLLLDVEERPEEVQGSDDADRDTREQVEHQRATERLPVGRPPCRMVAVEIAPHCDAAKPLADAPAASAAVGSREVADRDKRRSEDRGQGRTAGMSAECARADHGHQADRERHEAMLELGKRPPAFE